MIPKSGNMLVDILEAEEEEFRREINYLPCGCFKICVCDEDDEIFE